MALVTGAGKGIGKAIASALGRRGLKVVVNSLNPDSANGVKDELVSAGIDAIAIPTDVNDLDAVKSMIEQAESHFGPVDVLVNNAAAPADYMLVIDVDGGIRGFSPVK